MTSASSNIIGTIHVFLRQVSTRWGTVRLLQDVQGRPPGFVADWPTTDSDLGALAATIAEAATTDCCDVAGVCAYYVLAIDDAGGAQQRSPRWRQQGGRETYSSEGSSPEEAATPAGVPSMMMRHLEASQRLAFEMTTRATGQIIAENARMSSRLEKLEGDRSEMIELHEDMLSQANDRALAGMKAEREAADRKTVIDAVLTPLTPVLVNGVLQHFRDKKAKAKATGAPGPDPRMDRLMALLASISPEQLEKMLADGALDLRQQNEIVEILRDLGGKPPPEPPQPKGPAPATHTAAAAAQPEQGSS